MRAGHKLVVCLSLHVVHTALNQCIWWTVPSMNAVVDLPPTSVLIGQCPQRGHLVDSAPNSCIWCQCPQRMHWVNNALSKCTYAVNAQHFKHIQLFEGDLHEGQHKAQLVDPLATKQERWLCNHDHTSQRNHHGNNNNPASQAGSQGAINAQMRRMGQFTIHFIKLAH